MNIVNILFLPDELLIEIFKHLTIDYKNLCNLEKTCKKFHSLLYRYDNILWKSCYAKVPFLLASGSKIEEGPWILFSPKLCHNWKQEYKRMIENHISFNDQTRNYEYSEELIKKLKLKAKSKKKGFLRIIGSALFAT